MKLTKNSRQKFLYPIMYKVYSNISYDLNQYEEIENFTIRDNKGNNKILHNNNGMFKEAPIKGNID